MSNTKRDPLLSDEDINDPKLVIPLGAKMIRDIYEADRAKDAELIQRLVDALHSFDPSGLFKKSIVPLAAAKAAGFKPSTP